MRKADAILYAENRIEAAVVCVFRGGARAGGYVVCDVGHAIQAAANAGVAGD